ncbi:MAG: hypothetical protein FWH03_07880 [Firmicutes bacterium]|nr:hypothetical protein [Bacillota bacterium]
MNIWQAIVLGFIQGATEFIPVSSSGHLLLARSVMGINGEFLLFDVLVHCATLIAVCTVFFKDIIKLWKPPFKIFGIILLVSIPAVLVGFLVMRFGPDEIFDSARFIWIFFLLSAALMLSAEIIAKKFAKKARQAAEKVENAANPALEPNKPSDESPQPEQAQPDDGSKQKSAAPLKGLTVKTAAAMGLMQSLALFPGVTRSGSTLFGGTVTKGKREDIAKFSFLMSIPIILGSLVLVAYQYATRASAGVVMPAVSWYAYLAGMITAGITGFFAIKLMLRVIAKANYKWFALYLLAVSIFSFVYNFLLGN